MKKTLQLMLVVCLFCVTIVSLAQGKIIFETAIDAKRSFAAPSKHMLHVVMKAAFAASALRPEARPGVIKAMKDDVSRSSCALLRGSGKEFTYVKSPDGYMEIELHDATGVLLFIQRTAWKSCH